VSTEDGMHNMHNEYLKNAFDLCSNRRYNKVSFNK